ncbi:MAG: hydroxyethylthiazole kinase, partial [Streptococcaceae bacterium]|nr:hydroxyethylthiazole kinase [Streptococcaceae bacterium]
MNHKFIEKIRQQNPLVHNITNIVVANDSANGLLAIGASPFMSDAQEELEDIAQIADVTVLNIGTLNHHQLAAMEKIGLACNLLNKPVILDPVGAGATAYRKAAVSKLLATVRFAMIKGNAGEIAAIADVKWQAVGVDAGSGDSDISTVAKQVALKYNCIVGVTGEIDIITDGDKVIKVLNETPYFPKMTGSGCLLACIRGAFLAVSEKSAALEAAVAAFASYAVAGEKA